MASTLAASLRADRVSRLRLREVCGVKSGTPIEHVVRCMAEARTGSVLILDSQGLPIGIFTEHDYLNRIVAAGHDVSLPVDGVMTASPQMVGLHASVYEAVERMERGGFRHLPVLGDDGKPAGVLSVKAVMHYLVEYFPAKVYNLPPTPTPTQPAREGA